MTPRSQGPGVREGSNGQDPPLHQPEDGREAEAGFGEAEPQRWQRVSLAAGKSAVGFGVAGEDGVIGRDEALEGLPVS